MVNWKLVNRQPSTVNRQPSTVNLILHIRSYFALFSLLIALSSCSGIFGGNGSENHDASQKGTVTLNLGGGTLARIGWPPDIGAGSPARSDLEFEVRFSGVLINGTPVTGFPGLYTFFVPFGTHDIEIRTFVRSGTTTNPSAFRSHYATGRESGINVPGQGSTPVPIQMYQAGATALNPFMIFNETELSKVGRGTDNDPGFHHWTLDRHYRLMANITLTGGDWEPIGGIGTPFTGTFNGGGFNISGLTFNTTANGAFGMFGLSNGTIENLNLLNVNFLYNNISSNLNHLGGVVGINSGIVRNITVFGSLNFTGNDTFVGGVVGFNSGAGTVDNSSFSGTISSTWDYVGGVVGTNYGTVTRSRSSGTVSAGLIVGGIAGANQGILTNSHSSSNVSASGAVGGVAGGNIGTVSNSFFSGNVSCMGNSGSVVGYNGTTATVQNSAALNQSITRISGINTAFGRVYGFNNLGTITNNHARADMVFIDGGIPQPDFPDPVVSDPDGRHGADVSPGTLPGQFNNQDFWEITLGWDFTNVWEMQGLPPLPALRPPQ